VLAVGFKLEAYFVWDNLFVLSGNDHTNCTPSVSNFILLDCMYEFLWLFFCCCFFGLSMCYADVLCVRTE